MTAWLALWDTCLKHHLLCPIDRATSHVPSDSPPNSHLHTPCSISDLQRLPVPSGEWKQASIENHVQEALLKKPSIGRLVTMTYTYFYQTIEQLSAVSDSH